MSYDIIGDEDLDGILAGDDVIVGDDGILYSLSGDDDYAVGEDDVVIGDDYDVAGDEIIGAEDIIGAAEIIGGDDDYYATGDADAADVMAAAGADPRRLIQRMPRRIVTGPRRIVRRRPQRFVAARPQPQIVQRPRGQVMARPVARPIARPQTVMQRVQQVQPRVVQVRRSEPQRVRRLNLGLRSLIEVPSLDVQDIATRPQMLFRIEKMIVPSDIAGSFDILDLKVGNKSQFVASGPISARTYSQETQGAEIHCDTAELGKEIMVTVRNTSGAALRFQATLIGTVAD